MRYLAVSTVALCLIALVAQPAIAHDPSGVADPLANGRIPGVPTSGKVGRSTYRFLPAKKEYEVRTPGEPRHFLHGDPASHSTEHLSASDIEEVEDPEGEESEKNENELAPICRTDGRRIVVVYTHRPGQEVATETVRRVIRWTNWKIAHWSSVSSEGKRVVRMIVDCTPAGDISVYDVETAKNSPMALNAVPNQLFGYPTGAKAIKYLILDSEHRPSVGGFASFAVDGSKHESNLNANNTHAAMVYLWAAVSSEGKLYPYNTSLHELLHTLGAVQGALGAESAPFSTLGHCIDGLDVMCYPEGGTWEGLTYSNTYCPPSEGYGTVLNKPIDCGEDTYFDADPESGSWLDKHWNLAEPEDPFLVAPAKTSTDAASGVGENNAVLHGTVDPEGYNVSHSFEYGRTESYGRSTASKTIEFGAEPVAVSESLSNLLSGTTYHYRLVAENDAGVSYGEDKTFKTGAKPTWTVNDKAFTGTETDTWKANGIKFQSPGGETIKCSSGLGNGSISGGSSAAATPEFALCKLQVAGCLAKAASPALSSELVTVEGVIYEKYTVQAGKGDTWASNACFAGGKVSGSFAARIGPSAVESSRLFTVQAEEAVGTTLTVGGNKWQVRGTAKATLSGANKGAELGVMNDPPPHPPNESPIWYDEGLTFEEAGITEKMFSMTVDEGTTFTIAMDNSKIEIKCQEVSISGTLAKPGEGEATLNAGKCSINNPYCEVKPIEADFDIGLSGDEDGTTVETFTPSSEGRIYFDIVKKSGSCSLSEKQYIQANKGSSLGLEMDFGSEAEQHILGGSRSLALKGYGIDAADVWIDGLLTQQLNSSELFGAW